VKVNVLPVASVITTVAFGTGAPDATVPLSVVLEALPVEELLLPPPPQEIRSAEVIQMMMRAHVFIDLLLLKLELDLILFLLKFRSV
jgi:hypothetical protein